MFDVVYLSCGHSVITQQDVSIRGYLSKPEGVRGRRETLDRGSWLGRQSVWLEFARSLAQVLAVALTILIETSHTSQFCPCNWGGGGALS